ncbi:ROK family transcriptional regulator [Vibrio mediterranei]|uniref:ROK family transcriptional regulator n=1 Tax=Vibrio mediterranei TaxID=689 RepID=UPI001EFD701B|nr:ROK family transcriptional regulator [Vibrio mediterranei]
MLNTIYNQKLNLNSGQRGLLDIIRREGVTTRINLSRKSGMSRGAVTRSISALLSAGLIKEGDRLNGGRGQPSLELSLNRTGYYSIGIGFSLGSMDISIVDLTGEEIFSKSMYHDESQDFSSTISQVSKLISTSVREAKVQASYIIGVGYSITGFTKTDGITRYTATGFEHWRDEDILEEFQKCTGLPSWVENNANAAALGEFFCGAWAQTTDLIFIELGHGLGAGIIHNSKLVCGGHGNAGEIGGFFPKSKSRPSIASLMAQLEINNINEIPNDITHPVINDWIVQTAKDLKLVITSACYWLDPEVIAIGGSIPDHILNGLMEELKAHKLHSDNPDYPKPVISKSLSNNNSSAFGSAMIPLYERIYHSLFSVKSVAS